MSLFKNVTAFSYDDDVEPVDLAVLETAAAEHPARKPEPSQGYTIGFAPALYGRSPTRVHVADGGNLAMVSVRIEEKKVPGVLWAEETDRRVEDFQRVEGKYPSKEERDSLKGDAFVALLSRAFPKAKGVRVLFIRDQRLVLVGSASKDDVDSVTRLLRTALGTLKIRPVRQPGLTEATLTMWVKKGAPHDREAGTGFFLGEAATMSRDSIKGEGPAPVATVKNSDLRSEDVQEHLNHGKRVRRLAFACRLSEEFTVYGSVDKEFVLRGLDVSSGTSAPSDGDAGPDEASYYAGLFLLEARPLADMVKQLRGHLVHDEDQGGNGELFGDGSAQGAVAALDDAVRDTGGTASIEVNGKSVATFGEGPDPLYDDAKAFVIHLQKASISSLQRHLKIGYNRAARLIERMEAEGVVSHADPKKGTREVQVASFPQ